MVLFLLQSRVLVGVVVHKHERASLSLARARPLMFHCIIVIAVFVCVYIFSCVCMYVCVKVWNGRLALLHLS